DVMRTQHCFYHNTAQVTQLPAFNHKETSNKLKKSCPWQDKGTKVALIKFLFCFNREPSGHTSPPVLTWQTKALTLEA
ncbi:unnamed protein product, partial [Rangifer tarandus platyrhynchus]